MQDSTYPIPEKISWLIIPPTITGMVTTSPRRHTTTFPAGSANGNDYGYYLTSASSNNNLTSTTATGNTYGFYLASSSVKNNLFQSNASFNAKGGTGYGFYLDQSTDNNLTSLDRQQQHVWYLSLPGPE